MPKIVFLDAYTLNPGDLEWAALLAVGDCVFYDRTSPAQALERAQKADILLVNKFKLTPEILQKLPNLRYIGVTATGYDCVDVAAAKALGITITNVRGYSTMSVAQHTFGLITTLAWHAERYANEVKNGSWVNAQDWCYWHEPIPELANKTLGLIGLGDIGSAVARIGQAFGMKVIAYRQNITKPAPNGVQMATLDEVLSQADVLSLHCPLTADTREIINQNTIACMKPSVWLINTSRGGLLHEQAVADSLNTGRIAAAGLDVLSSEPPLATNPLLNAKNCYITPHQAWGTFEARQRLMAQVTANIKAFLDNNPVNVVA
jgi:glycerate dehydrogenase